MYVLLHEMMLFSPSDFLRHTVPCQEGTSGYSLFVVIVAKLELTIH